MTWNITAECMSVAILIIIWRYSRKGNPLPTLKNKLFQGCFLVTFLTIITNILSTVMLSNDVTVPLRLTWMVTTIYFLFTPLMGLIYFLYSASVVYSEKKQFLHALKWGILPGIVYVVLIAMNPITKHIFDITPQNGYVKGPLILIAYIIYYTYCFACALLFFLNRALMSKQLYRILIPIPVLAIFVIVIQQIFPEILLSGAMSVCTLLIIYLYIQNKPISIDYLTNVPNKAELLNMIGFHIKNSPAKPFTLLVVSLRNFKHINSTLGQQFGDMFLKSVCEYLSSITKPGSVYRFGGDEFAILLRTSNTQLISSLIGKIKERMTSSWQVEDYHCNLQSAIGIVNYPNSETTLENLVAAAEYAVITAKRNTNEQLCYCDRQMLDRLKRKQQIIQILKDALSNNDFELYYQPIFVLSTGQFQYAESLMRITNSPLGAISPAEFIPIAEETGLIIDITYLILDKVCKFVNEVHANKISLHAVHVNFSAIQFGQPNLCEKVCDIIQQNKTPFSAIKIEITESTIAENAQLIINFTEEMERRGIRMGLDDFGIGYSNIATVLNIPFSTIKLDKSLIYTAMEHERSGIAMKNLVRTFKELEMNVVAEGIETANQNQLAIDCNIDQIQGFYYARPMPEAEMIAFMLQNAAVSD